MRRAGTITQFKHVRENHDLRWRAGKPGERSRHRSWTCIIAVINKCYRLLVKDAMMLCAASREVGKISQMGGSLGNIKAQCIDHRQNADCIQRPVRRCHAKRERKVNAGTIGLYFLAIFGRGTGQQAEFGIIVGAKADDAVGTCQLRTA